MIRTSPGAGSSGDAPDADGCSNAYSSNRGRLNLAQRTKHFMRSNFVHSNNQPTSLKSLSLYGTNGSTSNNCDAVSVDAKKSQRSLTGNCKLLNPNTDSGEPTATGKSSSQAAAQCGSGGRFFSASRWAARSRGATNPAKVLASFPHQSDADNDLGPCSHHHNHHHSVESCGAPIRTLNTRQTQKASYLKSLISSASALSSSSLVGGGGAAAEASHGAQQLVGSQQRDDAAAIGSRSAAKLNQVSGPTTRQGGDKQRQAAVAAALQASLTFAHKAEPTKLPKYLNVKLGSNDCYAAYRSSPMSSLSDEAGKADAAATTTKDAVAGVQDVSAGGGGGRASDVDAPRTKLAETIAPQTPPKQRATLLSTGGRKSQFSTRTDFSNGDRMTHEQISSPSVASSFVLQSTGIISPDQPEQSAGADAHKRPVEAVAATGAPLAAAAAPSESRLNRTHRLSTIRSIGFARDEQKDKSVGKRSNSLHEVVRNLRLAQRTTGKEHRN